MSVPNVTTQTGPYVMFPVDDSAFNLTVGQPSEALIPRSLLDDSISRTISDNKDPYIYQYPTVQGPVPFRRDLAEYLSLSPLYPNVVSEHHLCATFGNSHGISLAIQSFTSPGDSVIVEDPTYFLCGQFIRDSHLNIHLCQIRDSDGMDTEEFESLVRTHSPSLVYINPVHQNPTGTCLSVPRREHLLRLAKEFNFMIVSDEPYVLLNFGDDADETQCSMAVTACRIFPTEPISPNLVCLGSFSKILTPGLRCGWIHGSESVISKIIKNGCLSSGGGPASLIVESIRQIMARGDLETHVKFLRAELKNRCDTVCAAIARFFPNREIAFTRPSGGYFLYLQFSLPGFDAQEFQEFMFAQKIPIKIMPSTLCTASTSQHNSNCMRIAFSFYTPDELGGAIRVLWDGYDLFIKHR
jgi:2-aminoadipate transaminase